MGGSSSSSQNLVSISNDGKLCYWSLENLNAPYDSQELIIKHATNRGVYASCMDIQTSCTGTGGSDSNDPTTGGNTATAASSDQRLAIVGTEDGLAHSFSISKYKYYRILF